MIKTVSLETSKLLKEAGFPQTFEFVWECIKGSNDNWLRCFKGGAKPYEDKFITRYCAPTTDELLEELPPNIKGDKFRITRLLNGVYCVYYGTMSQPSHESLPEALAQMWLWLKKENLLKSPNAD